MGRILKIATSTLLSGGVLNHGSKNNYIAASARKVLGMSLAQLADGQVNYFSKNVNILKRGIVQTAHQLAYGMLNSYPRYIKYWEQIERDKFLKNESKLSFVNKKGQYSQLIESQKVVYGSRGRKDTIVGNVVQDYLGLSLDQSGEYYDSATRQMVKNSKYFEGEFFDLQPVIQVSSKNNIVLTTVQGRDFTRKEFVSGGDYEITINGKITSKYPDVYPDAELSKFLKLMQYKGVIQCDNIILRQFKIDQLIVINYTLPSTEFRNIQPYTISCVAVEPTTQIEVIDQKAEKAKKAVMQTNKWLKLVTLGTKVINPVDFMQITRLWQ